MGRRGPLPPLGGPTRRRPEDRLFCGGGAFGRVVGGGGWRCGPAAVARAGLCNGTRLRSSRWNLAHGGRRAFLHGLDIRRRVQLSGDLARAWWALPLAAHARFGCGGGAAARADRAQTGLEASPPCGGMIRRPRAQANIFPPAPRPALISPSLPAASAPPPPSPLIPLF